MNRRQEIARRIKALREWREVKQGELAKKLGFSQAYLSDLESGKKPIPLETFFEIVEILDLDLEYFDLRKTPIISKQL